MNYSRLLLFCLALAFTQSLARAGDELDFLSGLEESRTLRQMLPNHVNGLARACLEARRQKIAFLTTAEAVLARKQYVRERIMTAIGGPPEKSPLNPRLVGVLERPEYRIEKLIFESQPRFYVTAHLYVPKSGRPPYPAILFPLGHEIDTKARPTWQRMLGTLATRGYVVLTYDPIGQGERVQLYDPDWGESKVFRNNTEHTILGIQCMLIGDNLARYSICDGLQALDYLVSRSEVDSSRIACTGNSGGGNLTAYLAALDDRIQVAAPSCWITSWQRLLETIGQQDAEQILIPALKDGLDYADFVYAFAPKPYMILSAMSDFFSITGTRETYEEAKRLYGVLGVSEKLERAEADAGHDYSETLRMAAYRWFGHWLKGVEGNDAEVAVTLAFEEELRCTPTGQVNTSLGGETVFSLNQKRVQALGRSVPELKNRADFTRFQEKTQQQVRQLLDLKTSQAEEKLAPVIRSYGKVVRSGYLIERLTYESEPGILIPTLLFLPESPAGRKAALIYVDGRGKSVAAGPDQELEKFAQAGLVVMAIDVRGLGETEVLESQQAHDVRPYFGDYDSAMTALVVGKPLVGMRALDISRGIDWLQQRVEVDPERIYGFGKGTASVPLLHAAVLDARLKKVVLEDMLWSYQAIVDNRIHRQVFENVVASVLRFYDLPDLVAALAPREVWVVNPTDAMQHPLPSQKTLQLYSFAQRAFQLAGDGSRLHVQARTSEAIVKAYPGLR
jgi:cephalosporin-C deacetylase-like acetyl esterase